ncbi:universal stress protein [Solwaraspora sp. WMMD791]|uniref:universal stress protein n=1 Tax=Solwaraspora sp. WMMD791 TaxID=3016086 RepID=UPI00249B48E7|nr:universal stress protein [Solwaraspora sp. WMMD791]WFE29408.1 universal stress protein [Solwaraspora sp. WMMD791]
MSTAGYVAVVVVVWVLSGVTAVAVFMTRRGRRAWYWYLLGAVLGLLFVPIAMERGATGTGRLETRTAPGRPGRSASAAGPRVLVAVDGSADADRALRTAREVLGDRVGELILATVVDLAPQVDPDERTEEEDEDLARAREVLRDRAGAASAGGRAGASRTEILTGTPARALLDTARRNDVDLIVIGRRGSGLSTRLLGGVADQVVRHADRPVLLAATEDA